MAVLATCVCIVCVVIVKALSCCLYHELYDEGSAAMVHATARPVCTSLSQITHTHTKHTHL